MDMVRNRGSKGMDRCPLVAVARASMGRWRSNKMMEPHALAPSRGLSDGLGRSVGAQMPLSALQDE
jgi:hypothetical protein